jgi:calcineurin-like phosphoesterase
MPPSPHNLPIRPVPGAGANTTQTLGGDAVNVREAYRFANVVSISATIGTTSIKFLDAPIGRRNFLGFRNASATQTLFIDFNADATTDSWLQLTAGTIILFDTVVPQDDLYCISSASGGTLAYAYSTYPG